MKVDEEIIIRYRLVLTEIEERVCYTVMFFYFSVVLVLVLTVRRITVHQDVNQSMVGRF